jgi:hypothetical protein
MQEEDVQSFIDYLNALQNSQLSLYIAESTWAFPAVETIHVFAICTVFGSIAIVDLRLLGLASTNRPFSELSREVLPWTWGAFALAALCGALLIITRPLTYFENHEFQTKFGFMALAGVNMLVFQLITSRNLDRWDRGRPSVAAKIAGGLSLGCWIGVVYYARLTGFTMVQGD